MLSGACLLGLDVEHSAAALVVISSFFFDFSVATLVSELGFLTRDPALDTLLEIGFELTGFSVLSAELSATTDLAVFSSL